MTAALALWLVATGIGIAAAAALNEYVRRRHPDHFEQVTGLPARRVEQLTETRRRAGTPTWRTR